VEVVTPEHFIDGQTVSIHVTDNEVFECSSLDDFEDRICSIERRVWLTPKKDAINPKHYQGYVSTPEVTLQWLETMQYLPHFRDPTCFLAAVELQVRKYLDRSGGKDEEIQETEKALWYLKFMTAYMVNGYKPIRVADIEKILGRK